MNFPRKDPNSEISAQRADALAMAGKILPGPGTIPHLPVANSHRHGRISRAVDF